MAGSTYVGGIEIHSMQMWRATLFLATFDAGKPISQSMSGGSHPHPPPKRHETNLCGANNQHAFIYALAFFRFQTWTI